MSINGICGRCRNRNRLSSDCVTCINGSHFVERPTIRYGYMPIPYRTGTDIRYDNMTKPNRNGTDAIDAIKHAYAAFALPDFDSGYCGPIAAFDIQDVIFNDPATIVFWYDGTKTVVKCRDGDAFDPEKGLAMAIARKALGNKGSYYGHIKKWVSKELSDKSKSRIILGRIACFEKTDDGLYAQIGLDHTIKVDKSVGFEITKDET